MFVYTSSTFAEMFAFLFGFHMFSTSDSDENRGFEKISILFFCETLPNFSVSSGAQIWKPCRYRQKLMQKIVALVHKIDVDTAVLLFYTQPLSMMIMAQPDVLLRCPVPLNQDKASPNRFAYRLERTWTEIIPKYQNDGLYWTAKIYFPNFRTTWREP